MGEDELNVPLNRDSFQALVAFTFASAEMRRKAIQMCALVGLECIDMVLFSSCYLTDQHQHQPQTSASTSSWESNTIQTTKFCNNPRGAIEIPKMYVSWTHIAIVHIVV